MRHGSLFSGIGGFDLAAEWMGWENVFHCEWMPFPRQVLHYYWPDAISYEDITKTDFTIHRGGIDILTGGFPCQPYSNAGKRLGKNDERHLWPEMLRAVREIEPTYIVGENVRGLTNWNGGVVFEEVCTDLESCGYEVQPLLLPASAVNAPHRRDRIWFVAYRNCTPTKHKISTRWNLLTSKSNDGNASDSNSIRCNQCECNDEINASKRRFYAFDDIDENDGQGFIANTECEGLQITTRAGKIPKEKGIVDEKKHQFTMRTTSISNKQNWQNFPTQSPICSGDDGIPTQLDGITFPKWRNDSIKGYGNAVVPQLVLQIFKTIQTYEQNSNARISG